MTVITTRMRAEMRMMREMGTSCRDIAESFGVSVSTVQHYCKGVVLAAPYDGAAIGRMWRVGSPTKDIADALGIREAQVRGYAKRHRDECPARRTNRTAEEVRELAANARGLRDGGMTCVEIARTLRISRRYASALTQGEGREQQ